MGLFNRLFGGGGNPGAPDPEPSEPTPEFPYELIRVRGADAVAKSLAWREEWRGSFTPVILGPAKNFGHLTDLWDEIKDLPQDFVQLSHKVELKPWFAQRLEESAPLDELTDASAWNRNAGAAAGFHTIADTLSRKVHPLVWVAKIPTAHTFEVPAYLKWGGWNACPVPQEHVAIWRYWHEKFGAEILCVTGDVIEATVARPPLEKEECYALAHEQFSYCEDILTQGVGSIDALAATVLGGKSWFFWWD
jgi:hypothetical protein